MLAYYGRLKGLSAHASLEQARALLDRVELREWELKQLAGRLDELAQPRVNRVPR